MILLQIFIEFFFEKIIFIKKIFNSTSSSAIFASLLAVFLHLLLSTFAFVLPFDTFLGLPNVLAFGSSEVRIQTLAIGTESGVDIITATITYGKIMLYQ